MAYRCGSKSIAVKMIGKLEAAYSAMLCRNWNCSLCSKLKQKHWRNLITASKPERFITLTVDPKRGFNNVKHEVACIRSGVRDLKKRVERAFGPFEYCYVIELTKAGHAHAHVAQRGAFIPVQWLSHAWSAVGTGEIVDIRRINSRTAAGRYMAKYLTKDMVEYRRSAEGRPRVVSYSRRFFKDVGLEARERVPNPNVDGAWIVDQPLVELDIERARRDADWLPEAALVSWQKNLDERPLHRFGGQEIANMLHKAPPGVLDTQQRAFLSYDELLGL